MLGFYVLLEDPGANVIIIALHCCSGVFLKVMTYAILLINPDRWQQANTQQPIGVVGLVIIHVNVDSAVFLWWIQGRKFLSHLFSLDALLVNDLHTAMKSAVPPGSK